VLSQYDGEILWTDACLGRIFQLLQDQGMWENTVVMVTADHGEEFFDHGEKGHKNNLYQESVHVPLIVKYAREPHPGRDARLVSLVDVFPTVLELAQATYAGPLHGLSLLAPPPAGRTIFHELLVTRSTPRADGTGLDTRTEQWYAAQDGTLKLLTVPERGLTELYRLSDDPRETRNLAAAEPLAVTRLQQTLDAWQAAMERCAQSFQKGGLAELSSAEVERLRALGYLGK
jgi:arylsulfatase A-like enzyme